MIKIYFHRKEVKCGYNAAIHVNVPHHLYSHRPGGDGGTPWGPGAASAESCTHPAKHDRCFPPPIAERQRLPNVGINNIPTLVQVMAWRQPGDKPLSEPRMESLLTHICVTRPQWVNRSRPQQNGWHLAHNSLNALSWIKTDVFWFKFHWNLFLWDNKSAPLWVCCLLRAKPLPVPMLTYW